MDNPQEMVATLEGTIDRLKVIFVEGGEVPLNENIVEVRQLCVSVEEILRHNQKEKVSFWGDRRDYWHYLSEVVSKVKGLDICVKKVQALSQLTTGQGKGRALIRECLTEQLLADCIQNSISNKKRTKEWYHPNSILLTESLSQRVLNALYDLPNMNYDLTSEGLDLDETWPSFVLKSFQNPNALLSSEVQNQNTTMSPLLKILVSGTQEDAVDEKDQPNISTLERVVEEGPSKSFVHQDIPFSLELVGSLLADVQETLTDCHSHKGHAHFQTSPLPVLRVTKMDDITSCLSLLKDYITSWSHELSKMSTKLMDENRALQEKEVDLEMQLKDTILESESSETALINHLQVSREDLKIASSEFQRLTKENEMLTLELSQTRNKKQELEVMNFDLEEQLVRCDSENVGDDGRHRAYTIMEGSLQEKDQEISDLTLRLQEMELQTQQFQRDLSDARSSLENQGVIHETHLKANILALEERESSLKTENSKLLTQNESFTIELENMKVNMERELKESLERESNKLILVEQERDRAKAELKDVYNMVENETASLNFKLSSQNIELQKIREHSSKKDRRISEFRDLNKNLESQVNELSERCEITEQQIEELKVELQDVEGVLHDQRDEMGSLHEQLTEKTLGRDQERASILRLQTEWDSTHNQQQTEVRKMRRQIDLISNENEDLRKAFKKLLEQKVTLWQHADDLEQEQVAMGTWLDSKVITNCMSCDLIFTMFTRKHHCRSCGKVFCTKCCEKKLQLAVTKDPARVCDKCFNRIILKRTPFASTVINSANPEDFLLSQPRPSNLPKNHQFHEPPDNLGVSSAAPPPHPIQTIGMSSNSLNIERSVDFGGNSLQAKLLLQNQDSDLEEGEGQQAHSNSEGADIENRDLENTFRLASLSSGSTPDGQEFQPSSYDSMEYSVDPEIRQREAKKEKEKENMIDQSIYSISNKEYRVTTVPGETINESYCLIDAEPEMGISLRGLDVNALASRLATLEDGDLEGDVVEEDTNNNVRKMLNRSLSGRANCPEVMEVDVEGGGLHRVLVKIEKSGTAIAWEFSTEPKGIAFGICYKETRESQGEDEVLPLKRCVSHKTTLTGEYCAQKKGVYVLKFDNCHSKFSGRKLMYKVWIKSPS